MLRDLSYNPVVYQLSKFVVICAVILTIIASMTVSFNAPGVAVVTEFAVDVAEFAVAVDIPDFIGTFAENIVVGETITGNNNTLHSENGTIRGNNNTVHGANNRITGNNNRFTRDAGNTVTGGNNNREIR